MLLVSKHHLTYVCVRFNICAPGTSVPTAEDHDEELISAASHCEAQLNTGVSYDTNANIITMFSENTLRSIIFGGKNTFLNICCLQYRIMSHHASSRIHSLSAFLQNLKDV